MYSRGAGRDAYSADAAVWDDTLLEIDREESKDNTSGIWESLDRVDEASSLEVGVWDVWDRDVGEENWPQRESPMKKRRARNSGATSGRRRGVRKCSRGNPTTPPPTRATHNSSVMSPIPFTELSLPDPNHGGASGFEGSGRTAEELQSLEQYMDQYQAGSVGFIPIGTYLFVVQGWNKTKSEPTNRWFHLQALRVGEEVRITCKCPDGDRDGRCVHSETYLEFRDEDFREVEERMFRDGHVVWFWRERENRDASEGLLWTNRFSVGHGRDGINGRAMVTYSGLDSGGGVWSCSKCSGTCMHTAAAKSFFQQVLGEDVGEEFDANDMASEVEENVLMFEDGNNVNVVRQEETAISYLPIRPPEWAEIPGDTVHYQRLTRVDSFPSKIPLGESNRSSCGRGPSVIPDHLKVIKPCTIYTLTQKLTVEIELEPCSICQHRSHCFIGPDTRDLGLFNYNNSVLFTHEVLDEYTSRYTACETPFVAFVEAMGRVYSGRGGSFVKEDLFRSVWFAYVNIQDFSRDMTCDQCGTEPDCLIWDGVTLGFGRKHLSDSLKPPTHTDNSSPIRQRTYPKKPQMLPETRDQPLRRLVRRWVTASMKKKGSGSNDERDSARDSESFDLILRRLVLISEEMASLFKQTFTPNAQIDTKLKKLYGALFEQVAAEESVLQMIMPRSFGGLKDFTIRQDWNSASRLVDIPALYNVLEGEMKVNGRYPKDVIEASRWMHERAVQVLEHVTAKDAGISEEVAVNDTEDWKVADRVLL
ncbi:hypothetical protein AAF712_005537 [Marasmius tenuissimus]|uniref:HMG domain-containing protein n=1 Tax=Marasmius tenuissimus TaxID=585030 RepID=A0ABR2ZZY3_9AGAR